MQDADLNDDGMVSLPSSSFILCNKISRSIITSFW